MKKKFHIPIYDCNVWLVVDKNIGQARKRFEKLFGPGPDDANYDALCSHSGGHNFGLFFSNASIKKMEVVAHEVFHLTHRIMEWAGMNFDREHHEQGALLHGYLMNLVSKQSRTKK